MMTWSLLAMIILPSTCLALLDATKEKTPTTLVLSSRPQQNSTTLAHPGQENTTSISHVSRIRIRGPHQGRIVHGFLAAFSVIIVSELGDKTFFIAAIMAMRLNRVATYLGAMVALFVMTAISACLGLASMILPHLYTHYACAALFVIFGLKMLHDGFTMSPSGSQEEFNDAQKMVSSKGGEVDLEGAQDARGDKNGSKSRSLSVYTVFFQALTLTFLAEWGDRSQLATIVLAAEEDPAAVTVGAVAGHGACTLLAVLGGRMVAQRISVRTVTIVGGITFLAFAVFAVIRGPG